MIFLPTVRFFMRHLVLLYFFRKTVTSAFQGHFFEPQ
jgi:hypothetical protein